MPPSPTIRRQQTTPQHVLLAILLLWSAAYFAAGTQTLIHSLTYWRDQVRQPFDFGFHMRAISGIQKEATEAGARKGDQVLAIDGKPFRGFNQLLDDLRASRPGDTMRADIARPDGSRKQIAIRLAAETPTRPTTGDWVTSLLISVLFPGFCLMVGFWVAFAPAARPQRVADPGNDAGVLRPGAAARSGWAVAGGRADLEHSNAGSSIADTRSINRKGRASKRGLFVEWTLTVTSRTLLPVRCLRVSGAACG